MHLIEVKKTKKSSKIINIINSWWELLKKKILISSVAGLACSDSIIPEKSKVNCEEKGINDSQIDTNYKEIIDTFMLEQHEKLMERYEKLIDSGTDEELINLLYSADPLPKMPRTLFGLIFFCIFFIAWLDDAYNTKFIDTLAEIAYRWLEPHNWIYVALLHWNIKPWGVWRSLRYMNFLHRKDPHFVVYHYYKFIDLSDTNLIHYCRDKSGNFIPNRMLENLATDPSSYFVNRPNTINAIVLFGSLIFIGVTAFAYYKVYCEKKRIALEEKFYVKINHISNNVTLKSNESQIGNAIIEFKNTSSEIKDIYWDSSRILLHEKIEKQNLILYLKIKLIDSKKKSFKSPLEKITDCLNENFFTFIDNFVNLDFFYYIPALLLIVAMLPTVYYYFLLYKSNVKTWFHKKIIQLLKTFP